MLGEVLKIWLALRERLVVTLLETKELLDELFDAVPDTLLQAVVL